MRFGGKHSAGFECIGGIRGLPNELCHELVDRIREFEELYERKVFERKDAEIPRIKKIDYIIAAITGVVLTAYLIVSLVIG